MNQEEEYPIGTPREEDHGWWNCDGCRERLHKFNVERVCDRRYSDMFGHYFNIEYLEDMRDWLSDREEYEQAAKVRDFIRDWRIQEYGGMMVPRSPYY